MIQRQTKGMLTQTCDLVQEQETQGDFYESVKTILSVDSSIPCRIIKIGQRGTDAGDIVGQQEVMTDEYTLIVPYDTALDVNYKVECEGLTYNVVRIVTDLTDRVFRQAVITRQR